MCQHSTASGSGSNGGRLSATTRKLIPDHPSAHAALDLAESALPTAILNHSFRVYLYARAFNSKYESSETPASTSPVKTVSIEPHVLFVACMLHDISVTEKYDL